MESKKKSKRDFKICPFSSLRQVLFKVFFFYYPTTEQDRLVQYKACIDPFSFLGPYHEKGERRREREERE